MSDTQTGNLQTSRGIIVNVDVKEATGAKGPYKLYTFTLNTGKTFKLFGTNKSDLPSLDKKEVTGLVNGAEIVVAESKNGKYLNVIGVDVLPGTHQTTSTQTVNVPTQQTAQVTITGATSPSNTASEHPSDRDASIVIQAIMKSLLEGAGPMYLRKNTTEDGVEYLNINRAALRMHIKECLAIHDHLVKIRTGKTDEASETKE
jgi:hypothetical protein